MLGLSEPKSRVAKDWNEPLLPQDAGRVPVKGKLMMDRTDMTRNASGAPYYYKHAMLNMDLLLNSSSLPL